MNLPDGFELPAAPLKPAEHYVEGYQYTRGDAARRPEWYDGATLDTEAKSNLMIFAGQCVIRGAVFSHGFEIPHGSELEYGCLLHALGMWQEQGGSVGGMASKGHGRLSTSILGGEDGTEAVAAYVDHVAGSVERCRAWLEQVFREKEPKPEKPAKGKKSKTLVEESADG